MTEQERALELADSMRHGGFPIHQNVKDWRLVERGLRLLAATPAASSVVTDDLREAVARVFRDRNGCGKHRGCENEAEMVGCACLIDTDTAIAAISTAGYVIRPPVVTDEMVEVTARNAALDEAAKVADDVGEEFRTRNQTAYAEGFTDACDAIYIACRALKKEPANV